MTSRPRVYLDHHAAAPLDPRVRGAMAEAEDDAWANPSSPHREGQRARARIEAARERVARSIGAAPGDLVFTSGGTESCNLGVLGLAPRSAGSRVVTTSVEHPAVAGPLAKLEAAGIDVHRVGARAGVLDVDALVGQIDQHASMVVVQLVNHETGSIWPIERIAERCRAASVPLLVDAVQAYGKVPIDVSTLGASAVAIAAHKAGGPSGVGALWVARHVSIEPALLGGQQERGRRAGTPSVCACVGFGEAAGLVPERLARMPEVAARRDGFEAKLEAAGARTNGGRARVATCTNLSFHGWRGSLLVAALDLEGLAVASGPACSSGVDAPSRVVEALHPEEPARAASAIRFSLGPSTTADELERAAAIVADVVRRV